MKYIFLLVVVASIMFSGCSIHNGLTTNVNSHVTEVVLSKNNFKIIESVQGSSQAMYVFGMGGLSKKAMIAEARAEMLSNANIIGSSKAIVNETVEIKHSIFPIIRLFEVTVSAYVVEFTE